MGSVEMISSTVSYLVKPENFFVNGNVQFLKILWNPSSVFLKIAPGQTLSVDGGIYLS